MLIGRQLLKTEIILILLIKLVLIIGIKILFFPGANESEVPGWVSAAEWKSPP